MPPNEVEWTDYALILGDTMLQDIGHHLPNVAGSHAKKELIPHPLLCEERRPTRCNN